MFKIYYIYRFLDKHNNVIYVGKTYRDLDKRMYEHFGGNGHLLETDSRAYDRVYAVNYLEIESKADTTLLEIYFINKWKPILNTADKEDDSMSASLNNKFKWLNYPLDELRQRIDDSQKPKKPKSKSKTKTVAKKRKSSTKKSVLKSNDSWFVKGIVILGSILLCYVWWILSGLG